MPCGSQEGLTYEEDTEYTLEQKKTHVGGDIKAEGTCFYKRVHSMIKKI